MSKATSDIKKALRSTLIKERQGLDPPFFDAASRKICEHIHAHATQQKVRWIFCYSGVRMEPDLTTLMDREAVAKLSPSLDPAQSYATALPKIRDGREMDFFSYQLGDPSTVNRFGILEPAPPCSPLSLDRDNGAILVLVPALAVDCLGNRLGYGGGYYDRYLSRSNMVATPHKFHTLAVVFSRFVVQRLESEAHDQKLSGYVTELGVTLV
jgi:5-formyltetrahydrofolate cyclo-ligase